MVSFLATFLSRLPERALPWLAKAGAVCVPGRVRGHEEACRRLLGPRPIESWRNRKAVESHALLLLEFLARLGGRQFPVHLCDHSFPHDRGQLFVTTHRGNWLLGAAALTERVGTVHTVAGVQFRSGWSERIDDWLSTRSIRVHTAGAFRELKRALNRGECVLLHLDGDPFPPEEGGWRQRPVPPGVRGAAVLAAATGVDVRLIHCLRRSDRFEISSRVLSTPLARGTVTRASETRASETRAWESELMETLRDSVAEAPEDWLIFRSSHLGEC